MAATRLVKKSANQMPKRKHPSLAPNRQLLTVKEVALMDNCSEKTVRRAIDAGLLDVLRVGPGGRMIRIEPAAHAAYRRAKYF